MRRIFVPLLGLVGAGYFEFALAQSAPPTPHPLILPHEPVDVGMPPDVTFPDAVICNVNSPDGVRYRMIFYKSETVSFNSEPNNAADYGPTIVRDVDKFDAKISYRWRLQLGKPGNITAFAIPSGWATENCPLGKTIADLVGDKQALKIFTPQ
jgi:hypothetical protein